MRKKKESKDIAFILFLVAVVLVTIALIFLLEIRGPMHLVTYAVSNGTAP